MNVKETERMGLVNSNHQLPEERSCPSDDLADLQRQFLCQFVVRLIFLPAFIVLQKLINKTNHIVKIQENKSSNYAL